MKKRYSAIAVAGLLVSHASLANVEVLTSVKPLQLIANEITQGVTQADVLLSNTASPHDYALKPSDVRRIKSADLVVWVGPQLESFLDHLLVDEDNSLELSKQNEIDFLSYSEENSDDHDHDHDHDHDQGDEYHDEHEGHSHSGLDPHIWLGPKQAQEIAQVISQKLSTIDAENAAIYQKNLVQFTQNLQQKTQSIHQTLEPLQSKGYYVFHDGYQYFESEFKLNNLGHFTVSPERAPGAKTLQAIRNELKSEQVSCVFAEPQFKPAIVDTVRQGTMVGYGVIDPLASDIEVKSGAYFDFLQSMADGFNQCLSE